MNCSFFQNEMGKPYCYIFFFVCKCVCKWYVLTRTKRIGSSFWSGSYVDMMLLSHLVYGSIVFSLRTMTLTIQKDEWIWGCHVPKT